MRELVGCSRVSLFTDKLNFKRPREGSRFRWHQDSPYWAHFARHLDQLPNVMLALDDASRAQRLPAHHRRQPPAADCCRAVRARSGWRRSSPIRAASTHRASRRRRCRPGSLLFFSPHAVHGSAPNDSDQPRRALLFTYQPGGERMFKRDGIREAGGAALVREAADVGDHVADLRVGERAAPGRHQR